MDPRSASTLIIFIFHGMWIELRSHQIHAISPDLMLYLTAEEATVQCSVHVGEGASSVWRTFEYRRPLTVGLANIYHRLRDTSPCDCVEKIRAVLIDSYGMYIGR